MRVFSTMNHTPAMERTLHVIGVLAAVYARVCDNLSWEKSFQRIHIQKDVIHKITGLEGSSLSPSDLY